jgi:hypothetical protein
LIVLVVGRRCHTKAFLGNAAGGPEARKGYEVFLAAFGLFAKKMGLEVVADVGTDIALEVSAGNAGMLLCGRFWPSL